MPDLTDLFVATYHPFAEEKPSWNLRILDLPTFDQALTEHGPLALSIAKWRKIVALQSEDIFTEGGGASTCALCHVYLAKANNVYACQWCPITIATGEQYCGDTPHDSHAHAVDRGDKDEARLLAKEMLAFLEYLQ